VINAELQSENTQTAAAMVT